MPDEDFPRNSKEEAVLREKKVFKGKKRSHESESHDGKRAHVREDKETIWHRKLTESDLIEGVLGLGLVRSCRETTVILQTAHRNTLELPVANVGKLCLSKLRDEDVPLKEMFKLGQFVSFRVTKRASTKEVKGRVFHCSPVASCDPKVVNQHIVPSQLTQGLVLGGTVESIEDKGVLCDLGFGALKGFIPVNGTGLVVGQPVLVRIEKITSRVLTVSPYVETEILSQAAVESLHLNHLMPGTILEVSPDRELLNGMVVELGNGVKGFLGSRMLPPRLRNDRSKFVKPIRAVVLVCQQNSNLLVLSAHPDVVAVSKPEKRTTFGNHRIGDTVVCTSLGHLEKGGCRFAFPAEGDKQCLFDAYASVEKLEPAKDMMKHYAPGSQHQCRIIRFDMLERSVLVATRKDILKQAAVSLTDAQPGGVVDAKVERIYSNGIAVKVFDSLPGWITTGMATERNIQQLDQLFKHDQNIKCRIMSVDHKRHQLSLTCRKQLVEYKGTIVTEYSDDYVGKLTLGVVNQITGKGNVTLRFFNGVGGIIFKSEIETLGPEGTVRENMALEVRVTGCSNKKRSHHQTLFLSLPGTPPKPDKKEMDAMKKDEAKAKKVTKKSDDTKRAEEGKAKVKPVKVKVLEVFTGRVVRVDPKNPNVVEVSLPGHVIGRLHASELPRKYLEVGTKPAEVFVSQMRGKNVTVKVVGLQKKRDKLTKVRLPELTMNEEKLAETRKKLRLFQVPQYYQPGGLVALFARVGNEKASAFHFDLHMDAQAIAVRESVPDDQMICPEGSTQLIPKVPEAGVMMHGWVTKSAGSERKKNGKKNNTTMVTLRYDDDIVVGSEVAARVMEISPSPLQVLFKLPNGKTGRLGPTQVTAIYTKAPEQLKAMQIGEIFKMVVAHKPAWLERLQKVELVTEQRWNGRHKAAKNPLIISATDLEVGAEVRGFVSNLGPDLVDVGCRVRVRVTSAKEKLKMNDLVLVKLEKEDEEGSFSGAVTRIIQSFGVDESALEAKDTRKRKNSNNADDDEEKPSKKLMTSKLLDADWNFKENLFIPENLTKVAELDGRKIKGEPEEDEDDNEEDGDEDEPEQPTPGPIVEKSKSEQVIDEEKRLLLTEEMGADEIPDSDADFEVLVKRQPNSARSWIIYMARFLKKDDLIGARNVAERALEAIGDREDNERLALSPMAPTIRGSSCSHGQAAASTPSSSKKQAAAILVKGGKDEEADELFKKMVKRFSKQQSEVWLLYAEFLLGRGEVKQANKLMEQAMGSVSKGLGKKLMSRYAEVLRAKGQVEQGNTLLQTMRGPIAVS
ncbi:unnamed protein product, partial [Mesorhabditis spiculigera]